MTFELDLRSLLDLEHNPVLPMTVHVIESPNGDLAIAFLDSQGEKRVYDVSGNTLSRPGPVEPAKPEPIRIAVQGFQPYVGMGG